MAPATAPSTRLPRKRGRFSNRCPEAIATSVTARPAPGDRPAVDFDGPGRLDVQVLKELGAPREADFYLCGPAAFMSGLTADLMNWGVSAERLHSENFGAGPALTPGVVAAPRGRRICRTGPLGRADGVFRQKQSGRALGFGVSEPARTGRGLRCAGAVGVSHRSVPQLRVRAYRRRGRLSSRSARAAGEGQSPDLLQPAARRCCAGSVKPRAGRPSEDRGVCRVAERTR